MKNLHKLNATEHIVAKIIQLIFVEFRFPYIKLVYSINFELNLIKIKNTIEVNCRKNMII
jgi:hypothetical protein